MKKILLIMLTLVLILGLAGCVVAPPDTGDDTTDQTAGQTTDPVQTDPSITETDAPESDTDPGTTEEQTTFGPLHFPEDTTQ